jgi:uncharacterized protein YegP (UPF0339 family)
MKYEILKAKDKTFYFVLKAKNGEIIITSETYKTKQACKKGIRSVKVNSIFSRTIDSTK